MATEKQIAANRRNAAKSTGPRTIKGKSRSRRNALKHGMCAEAIAVLDHEDIAEFHAFRADLIQEHQPSGVSEMLLIDQMAQSYLRLLRCRRIETGSLNLQLRATKTEMQAQNRTDLDNDAGLGFCLEDNAEQWRLHLRYEAAAERQFYRAFNMLLKLQDRKLRLAKQTPQPAQPEKSRNRNEEFGFVQSSVRIAAIAPKPAGPSPDAVVPGSINRTGCPPTVSLHSRAIGADHGLPRQTAPSATLRVCGLL